GARAHPVITSKAGEHKPHKHLQIAFMAEASRWCESNLQFGTPALRTKSAPAFALRYLPSGLVPKYAEPQLRPASCARRSCTIREPRCRTDWPIRAERLPPGVAVRQCLDSSKPSKPHPRSDCV